MSLPEMALSALHSAANDVASFRATHALSIIDPDEKVPKIDLPGSRHLVLRFHDVCTGTGQGPSWAEPPMGEL
ncbi:hypothetical protein [Microvirga arabica]|uniref:hypothetical protein n=1 Tax=Microvirga arabica TaxID=1128671 RepID=UPI00193ABDB8|nr:hypothetical protein [Microvirga arabica]MBM1175150.1 hypothetical protein [Microvirga arabica]